MNNQKGPSSPVRIIDASRASSSGKIVGPTLQHKARASAPRFAESPQGIIKEEKNEDDYSWSGTFSEGEHAAKGLKVIRQTTSFDDMRVLERIITMSSVEASSNDEGKRVPIPETGKDIKFDELEIDCQPVIRERRNASKLSKTKAIREEKMQEKFIKIAKRHM